VVVDDTKRSRDRVQLEYESPNQYDTEFYAELLIGAAESVCSPLGWRRTEIEEYLSMHRDASLSAYHL
jgi:DNA polymerase, archaea type